MAERTRVPSMTSSWLVQRLKKPHGNRLANAFSFGGGLRNGGLSEEAMSLIKGLWAFDYMGAAEFEWGAVPNALRRIAGQAERYVAFTLTIDLTDVEGDWRAEEGEPEGLATVYVIAREDWTDEVESRIRGWASERYNADLKEVTRLAAALRPHHDFDRDVCGWLELDNGFMFFTDGGMWADTCKLFGVDHDHKRVPVTRSGDDQ